MTVYVILLLVVVLVNLLPAFAPPTWSVLVFALIKFGLVLPYVVVIGVIGATLGRFILSQYIHWFSEQLFNERQEQNLRYLGNKLGHSPIANTLITFLYSLTPLSTTALFVAAGIARIRVLYVLTGFFFGRLISYYVLAMSAQTVVDDINLISVGHINQRTIATAALGMLCLFLFIFIDWIQLFETRKFALNLDIWKWSEKQDPSIIRHDQ